MMGEIEELASEIEAIRFDLDSLKFRYVALRDEAEPDSFEKRDARKTANAIEKAEVKLLEAERLLFGLV